MSERINDGGAAFPSDYFSHPPQHGMTLRDYFAGQALAGISPHIEGEIDKLDSDSKYFDKRVNEWYQCAAIRAYCYADKMLAAREASK